MIQDERIHALNEAPVNTRGRYVLYQMQQSQRASCNHALEYAIRQANDLGLPVLVSFGLISDYPGATTRHYAFMLEGLRETQQALASRGIRLIARADAPDRTALALGKDAALIIMDRGYLRIQRVWRKSVGEGAPCRAVEVESDAVIPVETAMDHEAYMAATIRPRITRLLPRFLVPLKETKPRLASLSLRLAGSELDLSDPVKLMRKLKVPVGRECVGRATGGAAAASDTLEDFLRLRLHHYDERRDDPNVEGTSGLSPYLHFGQISALEVALAAKETGRGKSADVFLEQLIVRRELAMNFTWYNPDYDRFAGLPNWAKATLAAEQKTKRVVVYDKAALESARTGDPIWNAAQMEMVKTGRMHNYMRMYWGKKILEWNESPEAAFAIAVELNDRYEIDGRDPNGYTGVAWCFGKHDRPWPRHPIFGNVRMMTAGGLAKKFDTGNYVRHMEAL